MKQIGLRTTYALAFLIAAALAANPTFADKPAWAAHAEKGESKGKGEAKGKGHDRDEESAGAPETKGKGHGHDRDKGSDRGPERHGAAVSHFSEHHRVVIHDYYVGQFRAGRCPPGLAKKHNGCMPPGQAKKWRIGRPLPRGVVFYELPPPLVVELGPPPPGYRYVRVAADILLIATGTGMVIDAIQDLGRM